MKSIIFVLVLVLVHSCLSGDAENFTSSICSDENNILLVPGVLTASSSNRACVSRFHTDGPATVLVQILAPNQLVVTARRDLPPGDGGCIDISVPQMPNTKADLFVSVEYPVQSCTWSQRVSLRVGSGRALVVQPERYRYRPGDTVRARILVFKHDLTPARSTSVDEVWLETPQGAVEWRAPHAAQWHDVRTRLGIAQVQYSMDDQAPFGLWTVRARLADGTQASAKVVVGDYKLPPFQLSVRHSRQVLRTSERLVWTVCVRYPWTEAVEGMLVIRIRGASDVGAYTSSGIRTAVRLRTPHACHRHAAAARRIGLSGANPPQVVIADFSFQEDGTRTWQNTTAITVVVDKAVTLEFLTKNRAVVSPGLPYKLKVKATRWDDKPAANTMVRVCKSSAKSTEASDGDCSQAVTDGSGVARVIFTAGDDGTAIYKFEATLHNDTSTAAYPLFLPVQRAGHVSAALGPLRADPNGGRTYAPLYLNVKNVSMAITVHFVVISRGGVIYRWGATTQCPVANSADQIQNLSRNSPCPSFDTNRFAMNSLVANASDALLDRYLLRVTLPIRMTHQMCPDSHLVAYFYLNGELVSASKHIEMEECFANKVEVSWSARQTAPGSMVSLNLTTPGPALCAVSALDTAAKWNKPGETLKDMILGSLKKLIGGHRNLTEYDAAGQCFLTSDSPDLPTSSSELTVAWLASAGVRIVGGNIPKTRTCSPSPMPLSAEERNYPRVHFPESWLWRLVTVGANGSGETSAHAPDSITRYEATAVCVAKTGISVSAPTVLQVFREFFIHADAPRRLRRGDTSIIRYRLFNYLYEPLSVQIQILTDPHLEGPRDYVEAACVGARASIARRVEVRARLPGAARVSIRAKSVKDGGCANVTTSKTGASDEVIIQMTVDPEGVPVQDQKSVLLCGRGSLESNSFQVQWNWPPVQAVPGTEALTAWAIGDFTGPLLADADDLVLLPRGCGEQNMARLATNLLALKHLDPNSSAALSAKEHVARGFTRQLQYVHPAGGFSAFGERDATPSTWLTAFTVRYLRKAHKTLTPDMQAPPALDSAERWLLDQQMENGCFRNEGQVFHRELRGGLNEEGEIASVALTAYVITSLAEGSVLPARVLRNALSCLRALPPLKTKSPTRVYAHSLLAYTFMRLRNYEDEVRGVNEAGLWKARDGKVEWLQQDEEMRELLELLRIAKRNGDFVWWETGSLATSIEATGYALLALSGCPAELRDTSCAHDARAAIRWLSTHRNSAGGFIATQDTLVALEALTAWSSVHPSTPTNLNVTARSSTTVKTVALQPGVTVPDVMKMGSGDHLSISVEGTGCALVQATRSYNSYTTESSGDKVLSVEATVHTDGAFDCANNTNCYCAAVVEVCVLWSGSFPEMALLEVSLPGGFAADVQKLYQQLSETDTLLRRIDLTSSSAKVTFYLGTRDGSSTLGRGGHQCYKLHAVGPQTKTKPAYARVMDYYRPEDNDTRMYTIPEECLPRIIHESNSYLASDNLFDKAKSLADNDEIVITHEFSFDDIPEGIPLEDPLYENLTKAKDEAELIKIKEDQRNETLVKSMKEVDEVMSLDIRSLEKGIDNNNKEKITNNPISKTHKINGKLAFDESNDNSKLKTGLIRENKSINEKNTDSENVKLDDDNEIPKTEYIDRQASVITDEVKMELKESETRQESDMEREVENPNLAGFHVIDSDKDLEVPEGQEGPIPAVVLPPPPFQPRGYLYPTGNPYVPWRRSTPEQLMMFRPYEPRRYFLQPGYDVHYVNNRYLRRYSSAVG
ncbi:pregnancy zone protein-like [Pectinophora gossypiella]|uniref:pregnancy zone protein-like n=1 Tax=Pectinophora gossypiella TaxID=13191 RepID=UPI00214F5035|nr:pregnancy zone protein-like [Pectinophora gossypiella]